MSSPTPSKPTISRENLARLLEALTALDTFIREKEDATGVFKLREGIYDNVAAFIVKQVEIEADEIYRKSHRQLIEYFRQWEHFSGDDDFPVPAVHTLSPRNDYSWVASHKVGWRLDDSYGRKRYCLLQHLIECTSCDLNAATKSEKMPERNPS